MAVVQPSRMSANRTASPSAVILSNYKALRDVPGRPREVGDCLGGWESRLGPCRGLESKFAAISTASEDLTRLLKVAVHGMARNDMC